MELRAGIRILKRAQCGTPEKHMTHICWNEGQLGVWPQRVFGG